MGLFLPIDVPVIAPDLTQMWCERHDLWCHDLFFFQGFCLSNACVSVVICEDRCDRQRPNHRNHDTLQRCGNSPCELRQQYCRCEKWFSADCCVCWHTYVTYETPCCSWWLSYWGHVCICCKCLRLIRMPESEARVLCGIFLCWFLTATLVKLQHCVARLAY